MVQRYQQEQLASPVTGTPGMDQSAGKAERAIAESAQNMKQAEAGMAMQQLRESEQDLLFARGAFMQIQAQNEAARARQQQLDKAEAAEQRKLQVQFDRLDEDDRIAGYVAGLKQKYSSNPQEAVAEFQKQIPLMRQQFDDRYKADPERLRMLMPGQRSQEHSALSDVQSWARTTITQNLNSRLGLLPEQLEEKIGGLSGSLDEQIFGYQKALQSNNEIYDGLRNSALTQASKDDIYMKQLQLNHKAAKQFVDHLVAQTPDGEAGMNHLDNVRKIVEFSRNYGIGLSADDKKSTLEHLHSQRGVHEQEVITGLRADTDLRLLDTNKLKFELYNAANDPKQMREIGLKVQSRFKDLDQQISVVSKEPDSKIRNAKLSGLKQEQNALIAEAGLDLKLVRGFEQIQRSLESQARSLVSFGQSQQRWNFYLQDRQDKTEAAAAMQTFQANQASFNTNWAGVVNSLRSAWSEPAGAKQQEAISKIVNDAMPKLNQAVTSGLISVDSYDKYMRQLEDQTQKANYKKIQNGFFPWDKPRVVTVTDPKERKKLEDASRAQFADVVKRNQDDFIAMNDAAQQVQTLTTSKAERTMLTQYVSANLPAFMKNPRYQQAAPQQQAALRAKWVQSKVTAFRRGELQ